MANEAVGVAQAMRGQALDAYPGASLIERPTMLTERTMPTLPGGENQYIGLAGKPVFEAIPHRPGTGTYRSRLVLVVLSTMP
jgi:hypothetical protein